MNKTLKRFHTIGLWSNKLSSSEVSTLIEVLKALNIGAWIPASFTIALLWKLYGFFNELSEKLTRIETKIDGLKDLLPYKVKEAIEQEKKTQAKNKAKKHNPALEKADWAEVTGVAFGLVDLLIFFMTIYESPTLINKLVFWILFLIPGLFGILPIVVSEKKISKENRAILSLVSLAPWVYLILVQLGIISPFL